MTSWNKSSNAWHRAVLAACLWMAAVAAHAQERIVVVTNWFAQAEHGGLYQALATGLYKKHGLDVTIKMGGPQINALQMLAAGEADVIMNRDFAVLKAIEQGIPAVTVAAPLQFDMTGILARDDVADLGALKGKTILIATTAHLYWWPWLKKKYGYTDAQSRPYTGNLQPFFSDPQTVQQALASAEPYQVAQKGMKARFFPFAEAGYPPYHGALVTLQRTIDQRPQVLARFVQASLEGWKSFLAEPAPAAGLIKKENPAMTDAEIAFAVQKLKELQAVTGGDAARLGIGAMTHERWKKTRDFMVEYGLLKPDTDWKKAYTLEFQQPSRVMP